MKTSVTRTKEQARRIVAAAFAPLECVAELQDYDNRLGFRIYSPDDQPVVTVEPIPVRRLLSGPSLATVIERAREVVIERGYSLDPWRMPVDAQV